MKRTKIVCTIGPALDKKNILKKMILAGMDVARLNFSHGGYSGHAEMIRYVRQVARQIDHPVAILADLQGPRVRVGELPKEGVWLVVKSDVILTTGPLGTKNAKKKIPVTYSSLHKDVKKGDQILLADGLFDLKVTDVRGRDIVCRVINGGTLTSHKGINVPTATLGIPSITEKDKRDLEFAISHDIDWVAMSFVKNAADILDLKRRIIKLEKKYKIKRETKIIVKIEKHEAVKNFDEILEVVDGVMVARGDLGIETPVEKVPLVQKMIIERSLSRAIPVITATQMLLSMVESPRPTRAEVSDVANAVIDHTDAVMLSQESAVGEYPVEAVKTMVEIVRDTEESPYDDLILKNYKEKVIPIDMAVAFAASTLAYDVKASAILVATISGYTARMVSRHRPELPIIVTAESEKVRRQLALSWGVIPYVLPKCKTVDELINKAVLLARKKKIVKKGDKVIVIGGQPVGKPGNANLIKIHTI
jgi:pyruvate kinase